MNSPVSKSDQISLLQLQQYIQNLGAVLKAGAPDGRGDEILKAAVQAQCVECNIQLAADDLIALAAPEPEPVQSQNKVSRMRQGYCARKGCSSHFYQVTLLPWPGVVWDEVLARAAAIDEEQLGAWSLAEVKLKADVRRERRAKALKTAAAAAIVVALLLVRQWIVGGRIPLLREPAKFQAASSTLVSGKACDNPKCSICVNVHDHSTNPPIGERGRHAPPVEILLPE